MEDGGPQKLRAALVLLLCIAMALWAPAAFAGVGTSGGVASASDHHTGLDELEEVGHHDEGAYSLLYNEDDGYLYVGSSSSDDLRKVDPETMDLVDSHDVVDSIEAIAKGSEGYLYIAIDDDGNENIQKIDPETMEMVASYDGPDNMLSAAYYDGHVFVGSRTDSSGNSHMVKLDADDLSPVTSETDSSPIQHIRIGSDGFGYYSTWNDVTRFQADPLVIGDTWDPGPDDITVSEVAVGGDYVYASTTEGWDECGDHQNCLVAKIDPGTMQMVDHWYYGDDMEEGLAYRDGFVYAQAADGYGFQIEAETMEPTAYWDQSEGSRPRRVTAGADNHLYSSDWNNVWRYSGIGPEADRTKGEVREGPEGWESDGIESIELGPGVGPDAVVELADPSTGDTLFVAQTEEDGTWVIEDDDFEEGTYLTRVYVGGELRWEKERELEQVDEPGWETLGVADDFTHRPRDVEYGPDGHLYVAGDDWGVWKFDPITMERAGGDDEYYDGEDIRHIGFGSDGYLYVGDSDARLQKVDPSDMTHVDTYSVGSSDYWRVAFPEMGDEYLYFVAQYSDPTIHKFDLDTFSTVDTYDGLGDDVRGFSYGDGHLYIATDGWDLERVEVDGMSYVSEYGGNNFPVLYHEGYVYTGDADGEVHQLDPETMDLAYGFDSVFTHDGTGTIRTLVADQRGIIYAGDNNNIVSAFEIDTGEHLGTYEEPRRTPLAMGIDPDDNIYVAESGLTSEQDVYKARFTPPQEFPTFVVVMEDPAIDRDSAFPVGASTAFSSTQELRIDVGDNDFPADEVEVVFYEYIDGNPSTDPVIGSDTLSTNGTASVTWDGLEPNQEHIWYAVADDKYIYTNSSFSDAYPFVPQDPGPVILSYTASPHNELVTGDDAQLSIEVEDSNLPDGDVTVEFYELVDGDPDTDPLIGTGTVTEQGGAATTTWSNFPDEAEWYAVAENDEGVRDASSAFIFWRPGHLEAVNATDGELVDHTTVHFNITGPDGQVSFAESDGVLDLGDVVDELGVEQGEPVTVRVSADGYIERVFELTSYIGENRIWLEEDDDTLTVRFVLNDQTGSFPPGDTALVVEDFVGPNNEYGVLHRQLFGAANQIDVELREGQEVRLSAENDGRTRDLGTYTATEEEVVELTIRSDDVVVSPGRSPFVSYEPSVRSLMERDDASIVAHVSPGDMELAVYSVTVYGPDGDSLDSFTSGSQDGGSHELVFDTTGMDGQSVEAVFEWRTADGTTGSSNQTFSVRAWSEGEGALIPALIGLGGDSAPNGFTALLALFSSVVVTAATARRAGTEAAGLAGVLTFGAAALVGFVPMTWVFGAGVTWLVLVALLHRI